MGRGCWHLGHFSVLPAISSFTANDWPHLQETLMGMVETNPQVESNFKMMPGHCVRPLVQTQPAIATITSKQGRVFLANGVFMNARSNGLTATLPFASKVAGTLRVPSAN